MHVSAAAPILNTTNATLGSTLTANTIRNFPLNGLDFSALTLYMPGAIDTAGYIGYDANSSAAPISLIHPT